MGKFDKLSYQYLLINVEGIVKSIFINNDNLMKYSLDKYLIYLWCIFYFTNNLKYILLYFLRHLSIIYSIC